MEKNEKKTKRVYNLIIVDESGSMSVIRRQAFAGMNETLQTVRKLQEQYQDTEQRVSLITFDSEHLKYHYDNVPAFKTENLSWTAYNPSAATPLYDAMGKAISKMNAQATDGDNVLVTIITDGEENCSREWTLTMVHTMIDKLKKQNWTFTLIGTDNLDVEGMAHSFAIDDHLSFHQDEEGTESMFAREHKVRCKINQCISEDIMIPTGSLFDE